MRESDWLGNTQPRHHDFEGSARFCEYCGRHVFAQVHPQYQVGDFVKLKCAPHNDQSLNSGQVESWYVAETDDRGTIAYMVRFSDGIVDAYDDTELRKA